MALFPPELASSTRDVAQIDPGSRGEHRPVRRHGLTTAWPGQVGERTEGRSNKAASSASGGSKTDLHRPSSSGGHGIGPPRPLRRPTPDPTMQLVAGDVQELELYPHAQRPRGQSLLVPL